MQPYLEINQKNKKETLEINQKTQKSPSKSIKKT